jgi:hypothetical protein
MKGALGSLLAVSLLVVVGCGGGGGDGDGDPCAGQDCSGHGRCVVEDGAAACDCDAGYHAEGLECVADGDDVCAGVDCSGHGVCYDDGGSPACDCDDGYHAEGLECVADGDDICAGVDCSGHGVCYDDGGSPACDCDDGYHAEGLACVADGDDVCAGVDCSGHGVCYDDGGSPACDCDDGYHAEGLDCVADADVCAGVDCSGHGVCYDDGGSPACDCDEGYHAEGLDCVAEGYEDWPPALDDLYSAGVGCTLPDCDEDLDAGFQPEGTWTATMTCIESNCSAMIQNTDPRAKPGEVTVEEGIALGQFAGTCGYDDQGVHTATGYDFTVASCEQGEVSMGVTPYQAALMTFDGDTASGTAHIYLTDVPLMAGGDCDFVMEVVYEQE